MCYIENAMKVHSRAIFSLQRVEVTGCKLPKFRYSFEIPTGAVLLKGIVPVGQKTDTQVGRNGSRHVTSFELIFTTLTDERLISDLGTSADCEKQEIGWYHGVYSSHIDQSSGQYGTFCYLDKRKALKRRFCECGSG